MTTTKLNDLFDQMEPEKGNKLDDKIQVEDSEVRELFERLYNIDKNKIMSSNVEKIIEIFESHYPQKYSAKNITKFSKVLTDEIIRSTIENRSGLLLNYLIQNSEDKNHTIHSEHLKYIIYIGYRNTKNIRIHGHAGVHAGRGMQSGKIEISGNASASLGEEMKGGTIVVEGDAGKYAGEGMLGGEIIINRNASSYLGRNMINGKITVNGNVKYPMGEGMLGGEIIINGNIEGLASDIGGKIYYKGELLR